PDRRTAWPRRSGSPHRRPRRRSTPRPDRPTGPRIRSARPRRARYPASLTRRAERTGRCDMCQDHYSGPVPEISLLRDVPLLTELTEAEMGQVEAATSVTDLLRGDLLFAEEETPTDLHVVV